MSIKIEKSKLNNICLLQYDTDKQRTYKKVVPIFYFFKLDLQLPNLENLRKVLGITWKTLQLQNDNFNLI